MGFRDLFRRKPMGLPDRIASITLEKMVTAWDLLRTQPDGTSMIFSFAIMAGAGHFTTQCLPRMKEFIGKPNPDLVALEALAFNHFAIRAVYPHGEQYEEDLLEEGFRLGGLDCLEIAVARVGGASKEVYFPRVSEYRRIAKTDGMQGAVSHFSRTLLDIRKATVPRLDYSAGSRTLPGIEYMLLNTSVLIFATTMPGGIAESLDLYLKDVGYFH